MNTDELQTVWTKQNREQVAAFIAEMGKEGECIKLESLTYWLWSLEDELEDRCRRYRQAIERDASFLEKDLIASYIPDIQRQIDKLKMRIRMMFVASDRKQRDTITPEMIVRAKDYPIEDLLPEGRKRGNHLCIEHSERNPSMSVRHNRVTCFSCGFHGDSIDVYMKLNGVAFAEAVRRLQ